mgnify:CR=1 FL=1
MTPSEAGGAGRSLPLPPSSCPYFFGHVHMKTRRPSTSMVCSAPSRPCRTRARRFASPGFSSFWNFGMSFRFRLGSRYSVTTVASAMLVSKRSWFRKRMRPSVMPDA